MNPDQQPAGNMVPPQQEAQGFQDEFGLIQNQEEAPQGQLQPHDDGLPPRIDVQNVPAGENVARYPMGDQAIDNNNNGGVMGPDQRGRVPQAQQLGFDNHNPVQQPGAQNNYAVQQPAAGNNNAVQQPGVGFQQLPQRDPYHQNAPRAWANLQRQEQYPRRIQEPVGYEVAPRGIYHQQIPDYT